MNVVLVGQVYALAALGENPHVVRYYSAWVEDDMLYIQTELVAGGSLASRVNHGELSFGDQEVRSLLRQLAVGLEHFHQRGLVHLDIKPENLYLTEEGIYKIGDLGLVSLAEEQNGMGDLSEGDPRYLAKEVLEGTSENITKGDVFSLGLSAYQLCRGAGRGDLPSNGEQWQAIRRGEIAPIAGISAETFELIRWMIHPDPKERPSAAELIASSVLLQPGDGLLLGELERERARRRDMERRVKELEESVRDMRQRQM